MRILVTGSSGHLGDALIRVLSSDGHQVVGLDLVQSLSTTVVGSIGDRELVRQALRDVDAVVHAATLHKPHIGTHPRQAFVDTNITGTLTLLEEAVAAGVGRFVFTSTTSSFGRALAPSEGEPAAWITEEVPPIPRNIYGASKVAAESLCELIHRDMGLPVVILRTSRFFPEPDDNAEIRANYSSANAQANEILYRRVDLSDVVDAHRLALDRAPDLGFGRFIISSTTPFTQLDRTELRTDAPAVVGRLFPEYSEIYARQGWRMFPSIDRVYLNRRARDILGWRPRYDFGRLLQQLSVGADPRSELAVKIGAKGYHQRSTGQYPDR